MPEQSPPHPPKSLSRSEKREFRRIIEARNALGRPVADAEINSVVDYVKVRYRLSDLEILAARSRNLSASGTYVQMLRMIDSTTVLSRRLAHDLGLILTPPKPTGKKLGEADPAAGENAGWDSLLAPTASPNGNPPS